MTQTSHEMLGYFAWLGGAFGALAWVPQLLKTWRRKSAQDMSWGLLALTCMALAAYTVYGLGWRLRDLLWAVAVQLVFVVPEIALKAWYDGPPRVRRPRFTTNKIRRPIDHNDHHDVDGLRW